MSDALLVVPPFSPSDTNPPLGPAVLRERIVHRGLSCEVADLNASFMSSFRTCAPRDRAGPLGDHGKSRTDLRRAREFFVDNVPLSPRDAVAVPHGSDPVWGMHFPFEALDLALRDALRARPSWWDQFVDRHLFSLHARPSVLGISMMGPSQVFAGLLIARMARNRWPESEVVIGGSHITLLSGAIKSQAQYRRSASDARFMFGHCEETFARFVERVRTGPTGSLVSIQDGAHATASPAWLRPSFSQAWLEYYERRSLVLPIQLTRGCSYGRCAFCTYPVVEPDVTPFHARRSAEAVRWLSELHEPAGISIKDSLLAGRMMAELARQLDGSAIRWTATTKIAPILSAVAMSLRQSGLHTVELGLESVIPRTQHRYRKKQAVGGAEEVIAELSRVGIEVVVNLIFGAPWESSEDAEEQLTWARRMGKQAGEGGIVFSASLLEVERGSPLATELGAERIAPWAQAYSATSCDLPAPLRSAVADLNGQRFAS